MEVFLNSRQQKLLEEHLKLVLFYNKTTNITAIKTVSDGKILHVEDSITPIHYIKYKDGFKIADLGSGAGFPGIPWAIVTGLDTTLIETSQKKCKILELMIKRLNIENLVKVYNGRIESIKNDKYDIVTARALSSLNSILELASPLLKIGGLLICYKSCDITEEENIASNVCDKFGFQNEYVKNYQLSNGDPRKIIVYKKITESQIKLPRKAGFAQKKPFIKK